MPPAVRTGWSFAWVGLGAAIALALGLCATFLILTSLQEDLFSRDRERRMAAISQTVTASLQQAGRFALAQAQTISLNSNIAKALGTQDRRQLLELSGPIFTSLKTNGVAVVGFQTPDLKTFLRVHQPDNFGDDISRTRPLLLAAIKTRLPQAGIEIGASGASARGAAPVTDAGQFLGTVEVGLSLDDVIEQAKTITNADFAIILSQSLSGASARDIHESFGDLVLAKSTDSALFGALLRDDTIALQRDVTLSHRQTRGVDSAILVQPLIDFSGRMIGVVAAVKGFSQHNIERQQTEVNLLAALAIAGIIAFAVFSILARLALRRLGASA